MLKQLGLGIPHPARECLFSCLAFFTGIQSASAGTPFPQSVESGGVARIPESDASKMPQQVRLLVLTPGSDEVFIGQYQALAVDEGLLDFDLVLVRLDTSVEQTRTAIGLKGHEALDPRWTLLGTDGAVLGQGRGVPEAATVVRALMGAGIHSPFPKLRAYVRAHGGNLSARLRLIQQLAHRSRRILKSEAAPKHPPQDAKLHGELARQVQDYMAQTGWPERAEGLAQTLAMLGADVPSPTLRSAFEACLPAIRVRCAQDPADFGAWSLLLRMAQASGQPARVPGLVQGGFTLPPGCAYLEIPPRLPSLLLEEARRTARWADAVPSLKAFWGDGGKRSIASYLGPKGISSRETMVMRAGPAWKAFALPCLEAMLRAGQEGEALALLEELNEGWSTMDPFGASAKLAREAGRPGFAKVLEQMRGPLVRPVAPGILSAQATLFVEEADRGKGWALADQLEILGIEARVQLVDAAWKPFLSWDLPKKTWALVEQKGRILDSGLEWEAPEEAARRWVGKGLESDGERARRILRDRPEDPEALALLAASLVREANALHRTSRRGTAGQGKERYQACLGEYIETADRLFSGDRLPRSLSWVLSRPDGSAGTFDEPFEALWRKIAKVLEARLSQVPEDRLYWENWCRIKGLQGLPCRPAFHPDEDLRELGLGPFPPEEVWPRLFETSSQAKSWGDVAEWLLPILEADLEAHEGPNQRISPTSAPWNRIAKGLPMLVTHMLEGGESERLEAFLARCASGGIRGLPLGRVSSALQEKHKERFVSLLQALE